MGLFGQAACLVVSSSADSWLSWLVVCCSRPCVSSSSTAQLCMEVEEMRYPDSGTSFRIGRCGSGGDPLPAVAVAAAAAARTLEGLLLAPEVADEARA